MHAPFFFQGSVLLQKKKDALLERVDHPSYQLDVSPLVDRSFRSVVKLPSSDPRELGEDAHRHIPNPPGAFRPYDDLILKCIS